MTIADIVKLAHIIASKNTTHDARVLCLARWRRVEADIAWRVVNNRQEAGATVREQQPLLRRAYRLTGKYTDYLRRHQLTIHVL